MEAKGPYLLLSIDDSGQFIIHPEGKNYLQQLHPPLTVIGVVGLYRSGKSLLLNKFMESDTNFVVGNTINACTKGIWIYSRVLQGQQILFLDTEGFGGRARSQNYDSRLFALTMLLSSVLIFNSKGVIDENALNSLYLSTFITEIIQLKIDQRSTFSDQQSELSRIAPRFIWVLRDFVLALEDKSGAPITPNEYFEHFLQQGRRSTEKQRLVRDTLMRIFTDRHCVTLPRPVDDEDMLQQLQTLSLSQFNPGFQEGFERLKNLAIFNGPQKKLFNATLGGEHLIFLLQQSIQQINEGDTPEIIDTWTSIQQEEYQKLLANSKSQFTARRNDLIEEIPVEDSYALQILQQAFDEGVQLIKQSNFHDDQLEEQTISQLEQHYQSNLQFIIKENYTASLLYNIQLISNRFDRIFSELERGGYEDELPRLEDDWIEQFIISAMEKYEEESKGPTRLIAITEYARQHQDSSSAQILREVVENLNKQLSELDLEEKFYEFRLRHVESGLNQRPNKGISDLRADIMANKLRGREIQNFIRQIQRTLLHQLQIIYRLLKSTKRQGRPSLITESEGISKQCTCIIM